MINEGIARNLFSKTRDPADPRDHSSFRKSLPILFLNEGFLVKGSSRALVNAAMKRQRRTFSEKSVIKPATLQAGPPFLWRVSLAYGNFFVERDRRGERLFEKKFFADY